MDNELLTTGIKYHNALTQMINAMNQKSATSSKTEIAALLFTYLKRMIQMQQDLDNVTTEDNIAEFSGKYSEAWAAIDNERKAFMAFLNTRDISVDSQKSYQAGLKMINQNELTQETLKTLEFI